MRRLAGVGGSALVELAYVTMARHVRQHAVERARRHIALEEVDREDVVMRVSAVPVNAAEGAELAEEVLAALQRVARDTAAVPAAPR